MFGGGNALCNGCLAYLYLLWVGNNPQQVKELWQKYHAEHKEEINEEKNNHNRTEMNCEVCWARLTKTHRPLSQKNIGNTLNWDEKIRGDMAGAEGGQNSAAFFAVL